MAFDSVAAQAASVFFAAVAGLAVGLLLRWLVTWLPHRIEQEWREQCHQAVGRAVPWADSEPNAPARGPLMLATAAAFAACVWRYGTSWQTVAAMACVAILIALAWIDSQTSLLPDVLTLTLLWAGLIVNLSNLFAPLSHAVLGAAGGYSLLWLIFHAYRLATGREGMGHGDFKLVAAAGAWVGFEVLPFLIVAASLMGVAGSLALRVVGRAKAGQALPFGPYIAMAFGATLLYK